MKVLILIYVIQGIYALPIGRPSLYIVAGSVKEGQTIKLTCTVSLRSSDTDPITWAWRCGDEDLSINSTANGGFSALSFTANRRHNEQLCYCKADAHSSLNETYSEMSRPKTIVVYYTPASSPKLNISKVSLFQGEEVAMGCLIDSLGNPEITWSWTCGTQRMRSRMQTRGLTSDIVITADPDLNEKICYCSVEVTYKQRFQANSNTALVSVIYNPSDYPRISRSTVNIGPGSPVVLQCSLSTTGNPPITWSWYCNDVIVAKGIRHRGKTTELSFVADHADDKKEYYCRARGSRSISGVPYDSKSSNCFIRISGSPQLYTGSNYRGVSPAAFAATLTLLLIALAVCSLVIFVQHRRIPKEKSLKTWFIKKIGKKSSTDSQPSETGFESEEHKYEDLRRGDPISKAKESTPTYQNLQIKRKDHKI